MDTYTLLFLVNGLPLLIIGVLICILIILDRSMIILFPIACGHEKDSFSGVCSKTLKEILLSISEALPSVDDLQHMKEDAVLFLNQVQTEFKRKFPDLTFDYIFAGSTEERFGIPVSYKRHIPDQYDTLKTDFDVMLCSDRYKATFNGTENMFSLDSQLEDLPGGNTGDLAQDKTLLTIEDLPDNVLDVPQLGFAQLRHTKPSPRESYDQILNSHKLIKDIYKVILAAKKASSIPINSVEVMGPSVKVRAVPRHVWVVSPSQIVNFEGDFTFAIKCLEWPRTSDWTARVRLWPSQHEVERITSKGFYLVAKSLRRHVTSCRRCHVTSDQIPTWRYSFSMAEVELARLVPETARKCFLAIKVIFKDHLKPVVPGLSTYHLKTIFFHTLEKTQPLFWVDEDVEECFFMLMREVHSVIKSKYCQNYWLRDVNLFDYMSDKDRKRLPRLARKIEAILEDPAPFIFDDGFCCYCCNYVCGHVGQNKAYRQRRQANLVQEVIVTETDHVQIV